MSTLPRALLLVLLAGACHRPGAAPLNPRAEVAVTVENQNFLDMDVFLIQGGQRVRLGMVPGFSSRILMVRPELIGYGTEVRFELHTIAVFSRMPVRRWASYSKPSSRYSVVRICVKVLDLCIRFNPAPTLLPVVHRAPFGALGILRMLVPYRGPIQRVDDGVPIAIQVGTHLKSARRTPLATLVRALTVQTPEIIRALGLGKDAVAMRSFHVPSSFLTPSPAGPDCDTGSPRSRAAIRARPLPRDRRWCARS